MAGRPRKVRNIQSHINSVDNSTFSGPMKMGTPPSIGKIKYYWHNYLVNCNQDPDKKKKSYANMVFLNLNSAQTPTPEAFTPSSLRTTYTYIPPPGVYYYDANRKYNQSFTRPYYPPAPVTAPTDPVPPTGINRQHTMRIKGLYY
jgi:hypothetical protein